MTPTDGDEHWRKPKEDMIKVNTDSALLIASANRL